MDTSTAHVIPSPFSISPHALNLRLGRSDAPLVLDVRREEKFAQSARFVATAQRCKPEDVSAFATSQPPR